MTIRKASVKVIGSNGQISLGKEFAGRQVTVEQQEPGVWLIRTAQVIPDNELWLHGASARSDLQESLAWSISHRPGESDPVDTIRKLENVGKSKRKTR